MGVHRGVHSCSHYGWWGQYQIGYDTLYLVPRVFQQPVAGNGLADILELHVPAMLELEVWIILEEPVCMQLYNIINECIAITTIYSRPILIDFLFLVH